MIWGDANDRLKAAQHAMDLGINYFDTAATYGNGQSEVNLGEVLVKLDKLPNVGSKVALQEEELRDIPLAIRRSVERSLLRLHIDTLDIVHLHNRVTAKRSPGDHLAIGALLTYEEMLGEKGVQETFLALKSEGKLRHFGFCAFGGDPVVYNAVADQGKFDSVLVFYNILNPSSARSMPSTFTQHDYANVLDRAKQNGVGAVALRVLEAGALSGSPIPHDLNRGGPSSDPEYSRNAERAQKLTFLQRTNETLAQVGIRFALANNSVSTVLVGFSDLSQIDEAVACVGQPDLTDAEYGELEELYASNFNVTG